MSGAFKANLIAAASVLVWATSFPATDRLLLSWSALPLAASRLLVAGLAVALLALAMGEAGTWRRAHLAPAALLGGLGLGGSVGLMILGQALTDGLTTAVSIAGMPVVAALLELPRRGRPGPAVLAGVALAVLGGVLLVWRPREGDLVLRGGEPLVLASVVVWCWYSRAVAKRMDGLPPTSQSAFTLAAGGVTLSVATFFAGATGLAPIRLALDGEVLLLLLWVGVVAVGLSLPLWLVAVRDLGLVPSAIHQNLGPFYVLALGLLLGQALVPQQAAAAALVVAGALLAQLAGPRSAAN